MILHPSTLLAFFGGGAAILLFGFWTQADLGFFLFLIFYCILFFPFVALIRVSKKSKEDGVFPAQATPSSKWVSWGVFIIAVIIVIYGFLNTAAFTNMIFSVFSYVILQPLMWFTGRA
jgi:hypothetical protein